jgi:hypothetical protein
MTDAIAQASNIADVIVAIANIALVLFFFLADFLAEALLSRPVSPRRGPEDF